MTIGDKFEAKIVKFVDINNSKNEDFNCSDQSVTQHCKSYLLTRLPSNLLFSFFLYYCRSIV